MTQNSSLKRDFELKVYCLKARFYFGFNSRITSWNSQLFAIQVGKNRTPISKWSIICLYLLSVIVVC